MSQHQASWSAASNQPFLSGTFTVPVRNLGSTDQTTLALSRIPATGTKHGTVLVLPDDPGASAVQQLPMLAQMMPPNITEQYDIVAVDHRFSGHSSPVNFEVSPDEMLWIFHRGREADDDLELQRQLASRASAHRPDTALSITSDNIVEDLAELIESSFTDAPVILLGQSYGGYIASALLTRHPHVAAGAIIDGAINPDWVWRPLFTNYAADCDLAINRYAEHHWAETYHVTADPATALHEQLAQLLAHAQSTPVRLSEELQANDTMLRMMTMLLASSETFWPAMDALVRAGQSDKPLDPQTAGMLSMMFNSRKLPGSTYSQLALLANDADWPQRLTEYEPDVTHGETTYRFLGGLMARPKATTFWPFPPSETTLTHGNPAAPHLLIVQPEHNMFTPVRSAHRLKEVWGDNASLVICEDLAETRTFPQMQNPTINAVVSAYLANPTSIDSQTVKRSDLS